MKTLFAPRESNSMPRISKSARAEWPISLTAGLAKTLSGAD
ncbi:MAG: hypothetical protein OXD29_14015 [Roseovarius sp.]|nr:hypothetical protein [Roseovarius sp.]MCY4316530.1 hypothetical protein [Roseovarius sp.]